MCPAPAPDPRPVLRHFPDLDRHQEHQFRHLDYLYRFWNGRVNLISRADVEHLYTRHVLHSLAIARLIDFAPGTQVLDVGTGGGFPGIPLAIRFPHVDFTLVDVIEKKVRVVDVIARNLGLRNVHVERVEAERAGGPFDFAVTRAVADLGTLHRWTKDLLKPGRENDLPGGLIALKGGELAAELSPFGAQAYQFPISEWFDDPWFAGKTVVYLPA
jgi:16S rRNA (guanine527-N7)-methyltransferase